MEIWSVSPDVDVRISVDCGLCLRGMGAVRAAKNLVVSGQLGRMIRVNVQAGRGVQKCK